MGGKSLFHANMKCGFSPTNIVKFYGSVTLRASLQNEIMTYLHFSGLNSLQRQYYLYIILLLMVMLFGPWLEPRKIQEFYKMMQFFKDFENKSEKTLCKKCIF